MTSAVPRSDVATAWAGSTLQCSGPSATTLKVKSKKSLRSGHRAASRQQHRRHGSQLTALPPRWPGSGRPVVEKWGRTESRTNGMLRCALLQNGSGPSTCFMHLDGGHGQALQDHAIRPCKAPGVSPPLQGTPRSGRLAPRLARRWQCKGSPGLPLAGGSALVPPTPSMLRAAFGVSTLSRKPMCAALHREVTF